MPWAPADVPATIARILVALVLIGLGVYVARRARETTRRHVMRLRGDPGLAVFAGRLTWFAILTFAGLSVLSLLGINWTSFLAVIGVVGLAVSLALQDVLKNLFAGFYILLERPFQIGDVIDVRTFGGSVEDIRLRVTVLRTPSGLQVVIPNGIMFSEAIVNRSAYASERLIVRVVNAGGADPRETEASVLRASDGAPGMLETPPPQITLVSLTPEKQTLDLACWTSDRAVTASAILASLRSALPKSEVSVDGSAQK